MKNELIYLPKRIFERRINSVELAVFALITRYDGHTLSMCAVAREAGVAFSAARKMLEKLIECGWVESETVSDGGAKLYRALLRAEREDCFPFPRAALPFAGTQKLTVLAYLCYLVSEGKELPTIKEFSRQAHLGRQTIRTHLVALKADGASERVPEAVAKLIELWNVAPARGGRKHKKTKP